MKYIGVIIIVILLGFGGYLFLHGVKKELPNITDTHTTTELAPSTPDNSVENPTVGSYKAPVVTSDDDQTTVK